MHVKSWKILDGLRWFNIQCTLYNNQEILISSFASKESALDFAKREGFLLKDQQVVVTK